MTEQRSNSYATIIIGVLFFIFGFITWVNGTLIPYLKIACELTDSQSYFITFAFYISYFFTAIPCSWILQRTGFKKGMMLGLLVMSLGAALFIPAALGRSYILFLGGLFVIGTGLSLLQTAANPYVTVVGPIESAASRISVMGICNKVAGALAPIIIGSIILSNADELKAQLLTLNEPDRIAKLNELASRVIMPYTWIAIGFAVLAFLVRFSPLPDIKEAPDATPEDKFDITKYPQLLFGVLTLFVYVGAEVIAGDTIGNYGMYWNISLDKSKIFTSYTLISMIVGYIIGIFLIPKYIKQEKALMISAFVGIAFTILVLSTSGFVSVAFVALLGLANALMWPAIWPMAINGLGKHTKIASALLIMAIAGGAVMPLLYSRLSVMFDSKQMGYVLLIVCYSAIAWYGYRFKIKAEAKVEVKVKV
jgi:FHS family L-fucose permease-like MFS transporter